MREISIKELGYYFLLKLKSLLIVIICCVCGLVIWQATMMKLSNKEKSEDEYINQNIFSDEEINQIEECYLAYLSYIDSLKYRDESVTMKLNPYEVNKVATNYLISCENSADLSSIVNSYEELINSGAIAARLDKENTSLSTLISASLGDLNNSNVEGGTSGKAIIVVEVLHESEEEAKELSELLQKELEYYCANVYNKIGAHNIDRVSQESFVITHNALITWQSQMRAATANEKNNYISKRNELTATQLKWFEKEYLKEEKIDNEVMVSNSALTVKNILLDIVASFLFAIILYFILYLISPLIQSIVGIKSKYNMRIIGVLPMFMKNGNKKIRNKILSKKYEEYLYGNFDETLTMICNNIKYFAQKEKFSNIFIQSDESKDSDELKNLIVALEKNNIKCILVEDFLNDLQNLDLLRKSDGIIFVKKEGVSHYQKFEKELLQCEADDIKVLGTVYVV